MTLSYSRLTCYEQNWALAVIKDTRCRHISTDRFPFMSSNKDAKVSRLMRRTIMVLKKRMQQEQFFFQCADLMKFMHKIWIH